MSGAVKLSLVMLWLLAACTSAGPDGRGNARPTQTSPPVESTDASATPTLAASAIAPALEGWWQPELGVSWQWQLDGPLDLAIEADVYDIDLFDHSAAVVDELHARGRKVICYISVGSWEEWRPDADDFPASVLGGDYEGWPGERWLDIRQLDVLAPIMEARLDLCSAKGFDAVEPDNMDAYTNETGFPLSYADQLAYNLWLAEAAHSRGLAIAMKNDGEQVDGLLAIYDFAITEDCFAQGWCAIFSPFSESGKPVLAAEYSDTGVDLDAFCALARELAFSPILKERDLMADVQYCD